LYCIRKQYLGVSVIEFDFTVIHIRTFIKACARSEIQSEDILSVMEKSIDAKYIFLNFAKLSL
jgi:hypothetical protein